MNQLSSFECYLKGKYHPSREELLTWSRDEQKGLLGKYGYSTLIYACQYGHSEVVRLLLEGQQVDPAVHGGLAVFCASRYGHSEVLRLLLADSRVDSTTGSDALRRAAKNGHLEAVKFMLTSEKADPAAFGNCAIREASEYGQSKVVQLLLADKRVSPTACCNDAIRKAFANGHLEVVELLLADQRMYPLKLEKLADLREIILTYLFQRYGQLLLIEDSSLVTGSRDIFGVITRMAASIYIECPK